MDLTSQAVVTGASGWLGQNLVRALASQRERVRCLVRDDDDASLLPDAPGVNPQAGVMTIALRNAEQFLA